MEFRFDQEKNLPVIILNFRAIGEFGVSGLYFEVYPKFHGEI